MVYNEVWGEDMKTGTIDFTEGHMLRNFIIFVIPLVITGLLQTLFNAADLIVVGRFAGETALAAVGATTSLINLIIGLAIGLSVGANVVSSIFIGGRNREMVKKTVDTSLVTALVCGFLCTATGVIFARPLLTAMDTPSDVLSEAVKYFRMYFTGVPAAMIYNFSAAILRANGETKRPLIYLSAAGVLNVALNLLFVIKFHMGASGVGLATALSQYLAAGMVVRDMIKSDELYRFDPKNIAPSYTVLKRILSVGIPSGIQSMVFSLSNILIQSSINSFGAVVVAGNAAAANIENFGYIAMNAFSVAATTVVGQNVGAKKYKRIDKVIIEAGLLVSAVGITLGVLMFVFARPLASLYCPDSLDAIEVARIRIMFIGLPYFLCGIMEVFTGSLKSCGYAMQTMIISLITCCGVRILWIYTVFKNVGTIQSIYVSYVTTWSLCIITCVVLYMFFTKKKLRRMEEIGI